MEDEEQLCKILEEMQLSGDMSFTCPGCGDFMNTDIIKCNCGFQNPMHIGRMNSSFWLK